MKHVLLLITTTLAMALLAIAPASAQQSRTLKSEMEVIHESLGVNFVYDSAIEINVPYLVTKFPFHGSLRLRSRM